MIDAYEIGIQLALQDGVSAGLESISRELAEVDRAIAATTAGLQGLTLAAQGAAQGAGQATAVTKAASGPMVERRKEAGPVDPETVSAPAPTAPVMQSGEGRASTEIKVPTASVPSAVESLGARVREVSPAAPSASAAAVSAPAASEAAAMTPPSATVAPVLPPVRETSVIAPLPLVAPPKEVESVTPSPSFAPNRERAGETRTVAIPVLGPRPDPTSPVRPRPQEPTVTASVKEALAKPATAPVTGPGSTADRRPRHEAPPQVAARAMPAAWSGAVDKVRRAPEGAMRETAAAPQGEGGGRSEGMTGTVTLDGRMIGYWLSEQMAREASRPPGGTTFFDPRQSPAWNASGAL